jgi:hypothetical protein
MPLLLLVTHERTVISDGNVAGWAGMVLMGEWFVIEIRGTGVPEAFVTSTRMM